MSSIKSEVLQAIKELIDEGVLYIDTEVFTTCTGYDSFGNGEGALDTVEVTSTLEVLGEK